MMAGVFDLELHDVEPVEVDSEDDCIGPLEVITIFFVIRHSKYWNCFCLPYYLLISSHTQYY